MPHRTTLLLFATCLACTSLFRAELVDGKTIRGWDGDARWWRVEDAR